MSQPKFASKYFKIETPRNGVQIYTDAGIVKTNADGVARLSGEQQAFFKASGIAIAPVEAPPMTDEQLALETENDAVGRLMAHIDQKRSERTLDEFQRPNQPNDILRM